MKEDIIAPTGQVVGIGKLKVLTNNTFPYKIPTLSFIVTKSEDGIYTASCLHLLLDSCGANEKEAIKELGCTCTDFLKTIFHNNEISPWEQLHELFTMDIPEWWNAYRDFQLNLAEKNVNTDNDFITALQKRIKELEKEIEEIKKDSSLQLKIVDYEELKQTA